MADQLSPRRQARHDDVVRREHAYALTHLDDLEPHRLDLSALVAAALVHLVVVAILAGAVLIWFTALTGVVKFLLSAPLAAVAYVVAPAHFHRRRAGLTPDGAPGIFAVTEDIASRLGVAAPRRIHVVEDVTLPWQQERSALSLSLPIWTALSPRGRVALLTLAVASAAGGGIRRRPFVAGASTSLNGWMFLLRPDTAPPPARPARRRLFGSGTTTRESGPRITDMVLPVVLFPVYLLVVGLSSWLRAATVASTQRDCYRAALSAARICGSEAVDEALRAALMWRRMSEEVEAARTRRRDPVAAAQSYLTGLDSAVLDAVRASGRTPPYAVDPTGAPPAALVQDVVDAAATVGSDTDSLTRLVSAAEADVTAPTA